MPKKKEVNRDIPKESDLDTIMEGFKESLRSVPVREFIHTGNYALDYIISMKVDGTGGYPSSCVVELFGDPMTGKSLLLAKALAEAQKKGYKIIIADAEGRWDDDFAEVQGVDPTQRTIFFPSTVEAFAVDTHKMLEGAKASGKRLAIVLDSLAILSTLKEVDDIGEGDLKADQGRKAQKIRMALRVLRSDVRDTGSILFVANHVIAQPGAYVPRTTPGGGGVPFQASVRLELMSPTKIKIEGKDRVIGVQLHVKVAKNSIAPPFGEVEFPVTWSGGIDPYGGLMALMEDLGIVTRAGAWYSWPVGEVPGLKFQSKDLSKFIQEHPEIMSDPKWTHNYFTTGEMP